MYELQPSTTLSTWMWPLEFWGVEGSHPYGEDRYSFICIPLETCSAIQSHCMPSIHLSCPFLLFSLPSLSQLLLCCVHMYSVWTRCPQIELQPSPGGHNPPPHILRAALSKGWLCMNTGRSTVAWLKCCPILDNRGRGALPFTHNALLCVSTMNPNEGLNRVSL